MIRIKHSHYIRRHKATRERLRSWLTRLGYYRPGRRPDILLLSTRRSGSTWLLETLSREPGLKFINEPNDYRFLKRSVARAIAEDQKAFQENLILSLSQQQEALLEQYLTQPGYTVLSGPYNPFRSDFHFFTNRRILKVNDINPVLPFLLGLGFVNLYLLRHPVSTILSNLNTIWSPQIRPFLDSDGYRRTYLTDQSLASELEKIAASGNEAQRCAANWALQIWPLWQYYQQDTVGNSFLLATYEDVLLAPEQMIERIAEYADLQNRRRILRGIATPSASTKDYRVAQGSFSGKNKVAEWQKKAPSGFEDDVFDVLDMFGIDFYERGATVAREAYRHGVVRTPPTP